MRRHHDVARNSTERIALIDEERAYPLVVPTKHRILEAILSHKILIDHLVPSCYIYMPKM